LPPSEFSYNKFISPRKEKGQDLVNIHTLHRRGRGGRNKVKSSEECRMRLDVKADKGYTHLKPNDQHEEDVTIR
jgi:hypothetical protein